VPEHGAFSEADRALLGHAASVLDEVRGHLDVQAFHLALTAIWKLVSDSNRYVDDQAPWALRKTDPDRMATVLYVLAETIRRLALLTQAFMPASSAMMLDQLGVDPGRRGLDALEAAHALKPGTALPKPQPIFPRYVEAEEGAA
jgi:methionyl-tRNA synthetase